MFGEPPAHVMKGYGKTIMMLAQRLKQDNFAMSNSGMIASGQLTAIETMTRNVSASSKHLAGMQQMMKSRSASSRPEQSTGKLQQAVSS